MKKFSHVCKELMVSDLERKFKNNPQIIVSRSRGMSVNEVDQFKQALRSADIDHFVVKNSLCKLALKKNNITELDNCIDGPVALSLKHDSPEVVSKIVAECAGKNESFEILGGYLEGAFVDPAKIKYIASLPSREVLLGRVAGQFNAPVSRFVSVLANTMNGIVYALNEIKNRKQKGEDNG